MVFFIVIYIVVRGKSFLVETETEEDYANVSDNDGSNEEGVFERALKPRAQNKGGCSRCIRCCDIFKHNK